MLIFNTFDKSSFWQLSINQTRVTCLTGSFSGQPGKLPPERLKQSAF